MADWEEVKRLAADFQKVQLSSTSQRLSERNCIEIVSWLIDRKLIDLIFTSDGKEYLTPSHLVQDIRNELYVNGGRINLVELAKIIGVDLAHINAHLNEVLKGQKDIHNVLGQLIDASYITRIAGEINEKLQQQGQLNVNDLTIQYDLPGDFLQNVVERNLGKVIFGKQDRSDPKLLFTESFVARSKAKIRGALAGLTRPVSVASILAQIDLNEKLFFSLFDQTSSTFGTLTSRQSGSQYIPNVYARSQNEWVSNFYKQNGYLEYDALTRLGISDHRAYIKKQLHSDDNVPLHSCVVSKTILERTEADIDECIASHTYVDLQTNLPSVFTEKDIAIILQKVLTPSKSQQTVTIDSYVISKPFIDNISKNCDDMMKTKAKACVETGRYQRHLVETQGTHGRTQQKFDEGDEKVDKREERRKKAAGGKSGGGTQGRETKTKSTKKHVRGGARNDDADDDWVESGEKKNVLEIVNGEDVKEVIRGPLEEEGLDDLIDPLTNYLLPKLSEQALQTASDYYAVTVADRTANRRQTHNELQAKLNALIGDVRLFEKGVKLLSGDLQSQLTKYLLKTLCTDIVTEILNYVAAEQGSNAIADNFNNDQRVKFVNELPGEFKAPLSPLVKSLTGQSIDDFMSTIEEALAACSMIVKKIDKKKDRLVVLNHKQQLLEELNKCEDLALVLHLATLVVFTSATQCMLHASGRHVAALLTFLKQYLTDEQAMEMTSYHDFVTLMLSNGSEAENAKEKLKEKVGVIKNIANEFKKTTGEKS